MVKHINLDDFRQAFVNYGRPNNFSYAGLEALYNYIEECEEDTGEPIELDVIALCCDFTEYETPMDAYRDYNYEIPEDEDEFLEDIENNFDTVLWVDDYNDLTSRIIIQRQ